MHQGHLARAAVLNQRAFEPSVSAVREVSVVAWDALQELELHLATFGKPFAEE